MKKYQDIATLLLRFTLASGFLSAVASRLSFWGNHSSGWKNFLAYTGEVNSFLSAGIIPSIAIISTVLETMPGILLLIGFKNTVCCIRYSSAYISICSCYDLFFWYKGSTGLFCICFLCSSISVSKYAAISPEY